MKILAVSTGTAQRLAGKSYKTGIAKSPVSGPVLIDAEGLVGDAICNRKHHGGPEQAVYVEGSLTLDWWAAELERPLPPGTFGENLVIEGIDNRLVAVGDRFNVGDVLLEATSARIPCATFAVHMDDPGFVKRYFRAGRPGIYCRVLSGGFVQAGMTVTYTPYGGEKVTMPELMETYGRIPAADYARYLSTPISAKIRMLLTAG